MMRVLDIDLDFFLADCCPLAEPGQRPALAGHEPWSEAQVIAFLEEQCGLRADAPLPGRVFETHDQALSFWEEKLAGGELTAPFHVTHVDAHSDLGIGFPGPNYILYNVLSMPVERRRDLAFFYAQRKLDEANYLLFALAMRRVASLDNVRNPRSRADIPQELVLGWPRSVLLGDEKLIVEQHQGIYACTQEEIVLRTQCGLMSITGENLSLSRYDRDGLVVLGKIEKLSYRPKG